MKKGACVASLSDFRRAEEALQMLDGIVLVQDGRKVSNVSGVGRSRVMQQVKAVSKGGDKGNDLDVALVPRVKGPGHWPGSRK